MFYKKLPYILVRIIIFLTFLTGCTTPESIVEPTMEKPPTTVPLPTTEIPPTPTPVPATESPPTPTGPDIITSAETLVGNWEPLRKHKDATYLQINPDGSCGQAFLLEALDKFPQVVCEYAFEGDDFLITAIELNGVPECPSPTGRYQIWFISEDQINIVVSEDSCGPRMHSTLGEYQRIP